MKRFRHLVEYALLRGVLFLIRLLSLERATRLANGLADIGWFFARKRRRIARENILNSGVLADPKAADALVRRVYRHFAVMAVESIQSTTRITEQNWKEHVTLHIPPETQALLDDPAQPVILASGHVGNWETAARVMSFIRPIMGIARPMNNPYVDRLLATRTARGGFQTMPKHGDDMGRFAAALKQGFVLTFMIDQHARSHGRMVAFFGRPASTHYALALLHLVTRVPIVFGYCVRTGPMRYEFRASAPHRYARSGNKEQDIERILLDLNHELEEAIRLNPEQYLWFHRRWKQKAVPQNGTH